MNMSIFILYLWIRKAKLNLVIQHDNAHSMYIVIIIQKSFYVMWRTSSSTDTPKNQTDNEARYGIEYVERLPNSKWYEYDIYFED